MSIDIRQTNDVEACLTLRRAIFIDEQNVPEADEIDDLDDVALHLLAFDGDVAVGTARLLIAGEVGKIGRVCVSKSHRGTRLGAALINASMDILRQQDGVQTAKLGAQIHALGFYEKLGFQAYGPEYLDGGIPHRDMTRAL